MKNVFQKFILMIPLLWFVSCNLPTKFSIVESEELYFNGLTSVHGKAVVESGAKKNLVVENAVLTFRYKSRELATARLMLPIEVPTGEVSHVRYDLKLESESLSNLQTLQRRMETTPERLMVTVRAQVRYGRICRMVEKRDIPYSEIIRTFGAITIE